jgi:hypothetical protein
MVDYLAEEGYSFVEGRSRAKSIELLRIADELGFEPSEVRARALPAGYTVPNEVAQKFESGAQGADLEEQNAEEVAAGSPTTPPETADAGTPASLALENAAIEDASPDAHDEPKENASTQVWADWAQKTKGYDPAEGLSRKELIERYSSTD